jgi:excisionase family DNA binding protein
MEQIPRSTYTGGTISVAEAARILGCSPPTIRRMSDRGELPGYKAGERAFVVDRQAVERMAEQRGGTPFKPGPRPKRTT